MNVDATDCLVIEDSVVGVKAAKAAGMKVVAVPSVQPEMDQYSIADSVLHSILELQPEVWGLPPYGDWIDNVLQVEPIFFKGFYTNGLLHEFTGDIMSVLPTQVFGNFIGWAKINSNKLLKILVRIGWENSNCSKRHIEAYLPEDDENLHDSEMEIVLLGYIRRSNNMETTNVLGIFDEDKSAAKAAFHRPEFSLDACKSLFSRMMSE
ncbi:unnamed protein product [Cuscuta campestris]|uniref:riboflavin kinase n=1 Tax=Cuscuta campestris TaxID=132261 RepID=A0A484KF59_9ASTE|nr:unnamed protein product [Cuscuta campestris]